MPCQIKKKVCFIFQSEEFRNYQENVVKNAQAMASELESLGYRIVTGGTDNHIVLLDMSTVKLSGAKAERILELVEISVNKNTGMRPFINDEFLPTPFVNLRSTKALMLSSQIT